MLRIISAAITPGIHPQMVNIKTINTDPQPLSITARGGNKTESTTLQKLIETNLQINTIAYMSFVKANVTHLANSKIITSYFNKL